MDELVVLAAALQVPPISLVVPVGHAAAMELLPGQEFEIGRARRWFDGTEDPAGRPVDRFARARLHDEIVARLLHQVADADNWMLARLQTPSDADEVMKEARAQEASAHEEMQRTAEAVGAGHSGSLNEPGAAADVEFAAEDARLHWERARRRWEMVAAIRRDVPQLRGLRRAMVRNGEVPAPLPEDLAWIDQEVTPDAS